MNNNRIIRLLVLWCVVLLLIIVSVNTDIYANESNTNYSEQVMVSLGDSYSSGEGVLEFYGQDLEDEQKVKNEDWLAHRSQNSWSGKLKLPGNEGTMADNKDKYWYFKAASGAITDNLTNSFTKEYQKGNYEGSYDLPPQLDIFKELDSQGIEVDYVTITIGGNDVQFADIITKCAVSTTFLNIGNLSDMLDNIWKNFDTEGGTKDKIIEAYMNISEAAPSADIIVAGYPQLLGKGKIFFISKNEAEIVNENVRDFNDAIESIVEACSSAGKKIHFVSVEEDFEGHEAYTDDAYIKSIMLMQPEDLKDSIGPSAYSMHPNEGGVEVYANCVQKKINEIEEKKLSASIDENMDLSDNPEASEKELEANKLHFSGVVMKPEDVVLKMFDALQKGNYEEAAECLDPASEQQIDFWGGIASTIVQLFTGEYISWGQMVLEAAGATEVNVIECYSENLVMESNVDLFSAMLPKLPWINNMFCTDADVYVKYRYKYNEKYYTVEEKYHVRRYEWSGWRIEGVYN